MKRATFARALRPGDEVELRSPHLVDATMFWSDGVGGVASYLRTKSDWLRRRSSWTHTVVVPGGVAARERVRAPRLPLGDGYRFPWRRREAARHLAALRPDLIEAGDPYRLAWSVLDAAEISAARAVAFCHSDVEQLAADVGGVPARQMARRYLYHLYRNFDAVFAASQWMVDRLRDLGLDNVIRQPLAVDLRVFQPARRDPEWRRQLGLGNDDFVLIYAGRFAPEKNLDVLTAVVDRLGEPFQLVLMGHGPVRPDGRRVRTLPPCTDRAAVATALASADAFVHAGESETFGLAALEALACGTPVVGRTRGAIAELLVTDGGIAVPTQRVESYCDAIEALRTGDMAKRRAAARASALAYGEDCVYGRLLTHYDGLVSRPLPRAVLEAVHA